MAAREATGNDTSRGAAESAESINERERQTGPRHEDGATSEAAIQASTPKEDLA